MSAPIRVEILQKAADGVLLEALFSEYGRRSALSGEAVTALAEAHNAGDVDLLALISPEALEPYRGKHTLFIGQSVYRALIPHLDAPVASLLEVVNILIDAAGSDGFARLPADEFARWCAADPSRPAELLALIDAKAPGAVRFLATALRAGMAVDADAFLDRAYGFLDSAELDERRGALMALGQIPVTDPAAWSRLAAAFEAQLASGPEDALRARLLKTTVDQLKAGPPEPTATALRAAAQTAVAPLGDLTLDEAARILAFDLDGLPPDLVEPLLAALESVNLAQAGTVQTLDFALAELLGAGHADRVRAFVETLLARDPELELETFEALVSKLVDPSGALLEDWIVAWLRNGSWRLCDQLSSALIGPDADGQVLTIDFARFGLREAEYGYLARKVIATSFVKPGVMASMLVSLLRSAPPAVAGALEALLLDPLLINYSGVAGRYLKTVADDPADAAGPAAKRALARLDGYIDGLKAMGSTPELHPSERERQLEWQRHSDLMSAAYTKARTDSPLLSLVPQSTMLYGARAVSWVKQPAAPARRIETPLASIGHSFEMPRIEVVDPLGLQYMLMSFRGEQPPP